MEDYNMGTALSVVPTKPSHLEAILDAMRLKHAAISVYLFPVADKANAPASPVGGAFPLI
jgi:hypothetical protein